MIEERELVTVPEAAQLLRVSTSTVRRMIDRGDIPVHRVGQRSVRLSRQELGRAAGFPTSRSSAPAPRLLTPAEWEAQGRALDRAREVRERDRRAGKLWPTEVDEINAGRDERLIDQRLDLR